MSDSPIDPLARRLSRRALLSGGLALCGWPAVSRLVRAASPAERRFEATPFTLGVASGDPAPDGFVLWTRLAPDPLNGGGMPGARVDVDWVVARDERLSAVVKRGRAAAVPESAHAVHVEVAGLDPDRWYYYQFRAGSDVSAIGRARTLPVTGAAVDRLHFAFVSCQHYEQGYYTALAHLAAEQPDLVFHLGDYIYEGSPIEGRPRRHANAEPKTLEAYRNRYAQYKMDPLLQAAHTVCPWIVTPDDHDVSNNYANAISNDGEPVDAFLLRRAAAYQAYYEHMPLRAASRPDGPNMQLYRQFSYGALASFFVLDTRQFRTDQACGDGTKAPCEGVFDPKATLLGEAQERWLFDGLDRSKAGWNVLPQQVMMARVDQSPGPDVRLSMDQWSGYDVPRTRLLKFLGDRRPANPVVLTGDIHSHWANDLKVDFDDEKSPTVATELVGTSVSSGGDGSDLPARMTRVLAENPFVKFHNGQRGYVSCRLTPRTLEAKYQVVEYVSRPGAPLITRATFIVEDGRPGAKRA